MSDFTQLPVKDGFKGCFDYTNYNGGDTWLNQYADGSGINFNMSNAVKNDGYILFPQMSGFGYLIDEIGDNFTVYAIIKGDKSTSANSNSTCWTITTFGADSSHRVYVGQYSDDNKYEFWTPSSISTGVSASEWHVVAYSVNNISQKCYIDGKLVASNGLYINQSVDNLCINTGAYNGAIPTVVKHSANVYVKYIGYAKDNHSELQIQQNSDWLLVQYGLKIPEKDLRLAGTDAVAIAYAIAKNTESASSLQEIAKNYKDGIREGNDTVVDKTDPIPNDDDEIVIAGGDDDTFPAEFERGGIYIKTKEITVTDDDGNEVTGIFQLQFGLGEMTTLALGGGYYDWGYPPKVTLTGNGIHKSQTFEKSDTETYANSWKGCTSASAPGATDGNNMWMINAKIYKSSARFGGVLYWEFGSAYLNRYWYLKGDFATALQNGDYVSTLPFDDVI